MVRTRARRKVEPTTPEPEARTEAKISEEPHTDSDSDTDHDMDHVSPSTKMESGETLQFIIDKTPAVPATGANSISSESSSDSSDSESEAEEAPAAKKKGYTYFLKIFCCFVCIAVQCTCKIVKPNC